MSQLSDPLARKIALWALVETNPDGMSYAELDGARRDLAGWPGAAGRESATEKVIEGGGLSPKAVIDWFAGADPHHGAGRDGAGGGLPGHRHSRRRRPR